MTTGMRLIVAAAVVAAGSVSGAAAQDVQSTTKDTASSASGADQDPMAQMDMSAGPSRWQFMRDGAVFGVFNRQGGPRGGREFRAPNWWMGMASRTIGRSRLTFTGMWSLDPATVGTQGYREIFQVGEVYAGRPLIDRQHPHDFFMQLAAVWRVSLGEHTGLTFAGAPAGEAALGPVAFMHRLSSSENPLAPLSHHTFDSTHVGYGVVTVALDHGPWVIEGSVFNGREPDEHRWDFDFGRLDSISTRAWLKPREHWEFQISTARLQDPEALEPGVVQRTTGSASWFIRSGADFTAVTAGYGLNATPHGRRAAAFGEATWHRGTHSLFGRAELVQIETALLITDSVPAFSDSADRKDTVAALTMGAVRDVMRVRGFEGGVGAALQVYAVPEPLRVTYGSHPISFQVFFRVRLPTGRGERMWNMRMSQPMSGDTMIDMPMGHTMADSGIADARR